MSYESQLVCRQSHLNDLLKLLPILSIPAALRHTIIHFGLPTVQRKQIVSRLLAPPDPVISLKPAFGLVLVRSKTEMTSIHSLVMHLPTTFLRGGRHELVQVPLLDFWRRSVILIA